ncbi:MAG TPA: flagellar biosynthetic protein FliR [Candidatus Eremiobacteraceae bacterium]
MIGHEDIALALGFAHTAAFAAAMPLGRSRAVPRVVRVVIALCLAPAAASAQHSDAESFRDWSAFAVAALVNAAHGAAIGLCATIVAGAAAAAGGLIDAAVASQSGPVRDVFGESGPAGLLCTSAFGWFFFGGAFNRLVQVCIAPDYHAIGASVVAALASACVQIALAAAGPAIVAQAFATAAAGGISRLAPRINGMFLGAPIGSMLVIASLIVGAGALVSALDAIAWRAAAAVGAHG